MRARRKRILAERSKDTETAVAMYPKNASRQPRDPHESSRLANRDEDARRPEPDLAASYAILEDDCTDSLAENTNSTIAGNDPTDNRKGDNTSNKVHGPPVIIEAHAVFEMISTPNANDGAPQTIISEYPLDDPSSLEYDSDSDSDTDSNSDFDPELDMAANQGQQWTISATLSRPQRNGEGSDTPRLPDPICDLPHDQSLFSFERSPIGFPTSGPQLSRSDENIPIIQNLTLKGTPLSPQLCNNITDVASTLEKDHRLQQALHQVVETCKKKSSTRNAILRWLSSLIHKNPSEESCEVSEEFHDEKIS